MKSLAPLCLGVLLLTATRSAADIYRWTGAGVDQNWSSGDNWIDDTLGAIGNPPGAADDVRFFDPSGSPSPVTNSIVDAAFGGTISSLRFGSTNYDYTIQFDPAQTLNVLGPGGLIAGTPGNPSNAVVRNVFLQGGQGTLNVSNSAASLAVNQSSIANGSSWVLDMSSLGTFTANLDRMGVGTTTLPNPGGAGHKEAGRLYLASNNTITLGHGDSLSNYLAANALNALEVGRNSGGNGGVGSALYLGQSTTMFVDSIGVGRDNAAANASGWMGFNPVYPFSSADFSGIGPADSPHRVTWWGIGDMNASGSPNQSSVGTNDFSGGVLHALVDVMSLGRDGSVVSTAPTPNIGVLLVTAGSIDVNTLILGNQSLGPSNSITPNLGILSVQGDVALTVNSDLILGRTTQTSPAARQTAGILNVGSGGSVRARAISVGAASTNNTVSIVSGGLVLATTAGSPARGLTTLNLDSANLELQLGLAAPNIVATNLVTGSTNFLTLDQSPILSAYPTQLVLIQYSGIIQGSGFNFTTNSVPPTVIGYLTNNTANSSVDFVILSDLRPFIPANGQPVSQTVNAGTMVFFTVQASGAAPLAYQWVKDGAPIQGANGNTYGFDTVQQTDAGDFSVVVTNSYGSITSAVATLTVNPPPSAPSIKVPPQDLVLAVGQDAVFTVTATGNPAPSYQWLRNGAFLKDGGNISGANSSTLTYSGVALADNNSSFSVIVANPLGSVPSSGARLTVFPPPSFSKQPVSQSVPTGPPVNLFVNVQSQFPLRYQWRLNGTDIPDATNSSYTIFSMAAGNSGSYHVIVYGSFGVVDSDFGFVTDSDVGFFPFSDSIAGAPQLPSDLSDTVSGSTIGATVEPGEPSPLGIPGGASVWATWVSPADGIATFTVTGNLFDSLLAIYPASPASPGPGTPAIAADDDSAGFLGSKVSFNVQSNAVYFIQIDGFFGASAPTPPAGTVLPPLPQSNFVLTWNVDPTPATLPVLTSFPHNQTVVPGTNLVLSVTATGGNLSYQWLFNGSPIPGQNGPDLLIPNIGITNVGAYEVQVGNSQGLSVTTLPASIQLDGNAAAGGDTATFIYDKFRAESDLGSGILPDPAPAGGFTGTHAFSTTYATTEPGEPHPCGKPGGASVWYSYLPPMSGLLTIDTTGSTFNNILAVYTTNGLGSDFTNMIPVDCSATNNAAGPEAVTFGAVAGTVYFIQVDGELDNAGHVLRGTVNINYHLNAPPVITNQPPSQTVAAGASLALSGGATGTPPLGYQWQLNGGSLPAANSTSYAVNNFQAGSQGSYTLTVTNLYGTATSTGAFLYLNSPLRFTNSAVSGGMFSSQLLGVATTNYIIVGSTDFVTWAPLVTNSSAYGILSFTDAQPATLLRRFYGARPK